MVQSHNLLRKFRSVKFLVFSLLNISFTLSIVIISSSTFHVHTYILTPMVKKEPANQVWAIMQASRLLPMQDTSSILFLKTTLHLSHKCNLSFFEATYDALFVIYFLFIKKPTNYSQFKLDFI